jgi:putative DNA primase/helicase
VTAGADPDDVAALALARVSERAARRSRTAAASRSNGSKPAPRDEPTTARRTLRVARASEIRPTKVRWLWRNWIAGDRLVLAGGRPGDGKSTLAIDLAARFSTGSPMPDRSRPDAPINVAVLSAEDSANDTIVPRLLAAGANLDRVSIVGGLVDEFNIERPWLLPQNVPELREFIKSAEIRLLIIDPLSAFQSSGVDAHRDGEVRAMLLPLSNMAAELECAVLAIRHHRKGGAADARDAGGGSIAYTAAARIEWTVGTDPADRTRRVLAVSKSNIGKTPRSLVYRIEQDEEWDTNRIHWEGASDLLASDLTAERKDGDERGAVDEAEDFLRTALADGPVLSKELDRQAKEAGVSPAALRRARQRLRLKPRKQPDGRWLTEPPHVEQQPREEAIQGRLDDPAEPVPEPEPIKASEPLRPGFGRPGEHSR